MSNDVAAHYDQQGVLDRILAGLVAAGKDLAKLTIDDLAPVDEFHSRRRRATEELAALLAPTASDHVVDVGSGIGGPSRYLAATYGCRVSGVDLTPAFVAAATGLTERVGLTDKVDFRIGSALALQFPDASFDLAWSQNVAMNIQDRPRYYAEMRRVLKPGGRLAIQDVAQGPGGPLVSRDVGRPARDQLPPHAGRHAGDARGRRLPGDAMDRQLRRSAGRGGGGARPDVRPVRTAGAGDPSDRRAERAREDAQRPAQSGGEADVTDQCAAGTGRLRRPRRGATRLPA